MNNKNIIKLDSLGGWSLDLGGIVKSIIKGK